MVGKYTRRVIPLVSATLTIVGSVIAFKLTQLLSNSNSLGIVGVGAWMAAGIIVTYLLSRLQARSQEERPEAIKERVSQLEPELRKQVQARSYGARRNLIEAPLRELDLDITPRLGWVRDPRLLEPAPVSENIADDIVAAFESSKRRMLIVGEPGSGKTIAAYSLIEYLDNIEGDERTPLLVNLSAWEAQEDFETFLIDYLCASVGYEVHERAVAMAFIDSDRYNLILDGLDEIPPRLRTHFSDRLNEFVQGLPGEVGVVVTCRTQEYEDILAAHSTGLGLVQAVEILPLSSEQLDRAFVELAKLDKDWETFMSQRHLRAYQRVRDLLSNPLFLNLAVGGHLSPGQLLDWSTIEQELRDLVLERYLDRTLVDQSHLEPADARRYLSWIARFLDGDEVSPFGLKATDYTAFDLADLTPPDPPKLYRLVGGLVIGLIFGLPVGLIFGLPYWVSALIYGLPWGLGYGLVFALTSGWPFKRSAVSSRLTLIWPSTRRQLIDLLRRAGRGLIWGLIYGLGLGLVLALVTGLAILLPEELAGGGLADKMFEVAADKGWEAGGMLVTVLVVWLIFALGFGLVLGLGLGLVWGLPLGLSLGLVLALRNGGWFVLLQKIAHRRLARAGNLPPRPYDFLEWGIEKQIIRRVGGGVRYRHNLIQQHLAKS
jgi:hypothetical protein